MSSSLIAFRIDEARLALPVEVVERVIRAVEITTLTNCRESVLGVINIGGVIVPVADLRKHLGLEARTLRLSDHNIVLSIDGCRFAIVVGNIDGVILENSSARYERVPGDGKVAGSFIQEDGDLITVLDLSEMASELQLLKFTLNSANEVTNR